MVILEKPAWPLISLLLISIYKHIFLTLNINQTIVKMIEINTQKTNNLVLISFSCISMGWAMLLCKSETISKIKKS